MIGLSGALMYDGYYSTCPSCVHSWARRGGAAAGGMSGEAFVNQPLILRWSPSTGGHLLILTPHTEVWS